MYISQDITMLIIQNYRNEQHYIIQDGTTTYSFYVTRQAIIGSQVYDIVATCEEVYKGEQFTYNNGSSMYNYLTNLLDTLLT